MFPAQQDTVCMEISTSLSLYFKMTLGFGNKFLEFENETTAANPSRNAEVAASRPKYLSSDLWKKGQICFIILFIMCSSYKQLAKSQTNLWFKHTWGVGS